MDATQALILDLEGKLKRCGNCKWFMPHESIQEGLGECYNDLVGREQLYDWRNEKTDQSLIPRNSLTMYDEEDYYQNFSHVIVGKDFGCIHFEVK